LHDRVGNRLWGQGFSERITNALRLQADISQQVAREIQAKLTPAELSRFAGIQVVDREAYKLLGEGIGFLEKGGPFTEVGSDSARRLLDLAAERLLAASRIEPRWATPLAYLAQTRHWQATTPGSIGNWQPRADSLYKLSEEAALSAIALDSNDAIAWSALGYVRRRWQWDWDSSRVAYANAIRSNRNAPDAEWGLALFYETTGDLGQAIAGLRSAFGRDSRSPVLQIHLSNALICADSVQEGLDNFPPDSTLERLSWARFVRANGLLRGGHYPAAIESFEDMMHPGEIPPANLALAYLKAGDTTNARRIVNERASAGETPSLVDHLVVGNTARLLATLSAMIKDKSLSPTVRCDPYFADLIAIEQARAMMEEGMQLQFQPRG
jgi:tetratricopeptide (TPR) repeat protein